MSKLRKKQPHIILNFIKKHKASILIFFIYIISLIPIIRISIYSRPSADDLLNSGYMRNFILGKTDVIQGVFGQSIYNWLNWQGRWSDFIINSFSPSIFYQDIYFITTIFIVSIITFSIVFFAKSVLVDILKLRIDFAIIVALLVCFWYINFLPDKMEGIFWWSGGANYIGQSCMVLVSMALLLKNLFLKNNKYQNINWIIAGFIVVFNSGAPFMVALLNQFFITSISLYVLIKYIKDKNNLLVKKQLLILLLILAISLVGLGLAIFAPGNQIRQAIFGSPNYQNFLITLPYALTDGLREYTKGLFSLFSFIIVLISFLYLRKNYQKLPKINSSSVIFSFIFSTISFLMLIMPVQYAKSSNLKRVLMMSGREMNALYFWFIIFVAINLFMWVLYILQNLKLSKSTFEKINSLLIILILFNSLNLIINKSYISDIKKSTTLQSVRDLQNLSAIKSAIEYDKCLKGTGETYNTVRTVIRNKNEWIPNKENLTDINACSNWNKVFDSYYRNKSSEVLHFY